MVNTGLDISHSVHQKSWADSASVILWGVLLGNPLRHVLSVHVQTSCTSHMHSCHPSF